MSQPLVIGNWKMYGYQAECVALARQIADGAQSHASAVKIIVAPPFTALSAVKAALADGIVSLAGQNCHWEERGAFTGEISAPMLRDIGCEYVLLGHSERRHIFLEDDAMIARKIGPVLANGMNPIVCVGETLSERERGQTFTVIARQLGVALKGLDEDGIQHVAVAYEPVWAIGTGRNATSLQVQEVHERIRNLLVQSFGKSLGGAVPILYGGSVKPENAQELAKTSEVGGLLVGGASLKAETFLPIVSCFTSE